MNNSLENESLFNYYCFHVDWLTWNNLSDLDINQKKLTSSYFEIEVTLKSTKSININEVPDKASPEILISYIAFNGED